jgi:predicted amidohydrolase
VRVAAVQFKADRANPKGARASLAGWVGRAAIGSDLVVCPEMAATGYIFADRAAASLVAEDPTGPTFQALRVHAKENGAWVVAGFPERAGDTLYNSAMVIDARGELAFVYRKTLLFEADETWACPGDSGYVAFETAFGRFGVGICMDLNDPMFLEWSSDSKLDALAFPTNWLDEGGDVWPYWRWRASQAGTTLIAANTYGHDAPLDFVGRSAVVTAARVLSGAPARGDVVVRATLKR